MQAYVLGFVFDELSDRVMLITKRRPKWQCGRLNSVGGKVEDHEFYREAMRRECREETGLDIDEQEWVYFASMRGPSTDIRCYAVSSPSMETAESKTDELIAFYDPTRLPSGAISNIYWLVPLAKDVARLRVHGESDGRPLVVATFDEDHD